MIVLALFLFLLPPCTGKNPNHNCFRVPIHFAANRFTFERFPPPPPLLHPNEYINTCTYLFVVHLNIILVVVSDGDDSTKGWNSLFENPRVIEVHELHEDLVYSENHSLVHHIVRHSSDPREKKSSLLFWREKKL